MGDLPVLAEPAGQVATDGSYRQNQGTGVKMIQGFFFDRIQGQGGNLSVTGRIQPAAPGDPHPAKAFFPFLKPAGPGAKGAPHPPGVIPVKTRLLLVSHSLSSSVVTGYLEPLQLY